MSGSLFKMKMHKAKHEQTVLFFFPAGFTYLWQYRWLFWYLNMRGITVIGCEVAWRRAVKEMTSIDDMILAIKNIDSEVSRIINQAHSKKLKYAVFGTSFGSVPALYCAKAHPEIRSIILNVPYGTLSHLIWTYKPLARFKRQLVLDGITEKKLQILTKPIETQYELDDIRDREIVVFTSQTDKIVFDGKTLVTALKRLKVSATYHETQYGHFWGAIENLMFVKKWIGKIQRTNED